MMLWEEVGMLSDGRDVRLYALMRMLDGGGLVG